MLRSYEDEEGEKDIENSLKLVLRDNNYIKDLYLMHDQIKHSKNMYKLYGYNKERKLNVVITKLMNISLKENPNFEKRLLTTIQLIEENQILIENLWLEKQEKLNYTLYISELTNSIYRNDYNLTTLNNYINDNNNSFDDNYSLLKIILQKLKYFESIKFSHLNINPNNIYINIQNNNIVYFGPPKLVKNFSNDCTCLWYSAPEEFYLTNEILENYKYGIANDIWSIGCIICEMFFINFPLFQTYSQTEKISRIFEILGIPKYDYVNYIDKNQYNIIVQKNHNKNKKNKLSDLLLLRKCENKTDNYKQNLIDIVLGCFKYDINKRINLNNIILRLNYVKKNDIKINDTKSVQMKTKLCDSNYSNSSINNNSINNKTMSFYKKPYKTCVDLNLNKGLEKSFFQKKLKLNTLTNNINYDIKELRVSKIKNQENNERNYRIKKSNTFSRININNNNHDAILDSNRKTITKKKSNIDREKINCGEKFSNEKYSDENVMDYVSPNKSRIKVDDEYQKLNRSKYIINY